MNKDGNLMLFKKPSGVSWLLVFLGNPGAKFSGSRHNVGFMTADVLEKRLNVRIERLRFKAMTAQAELGGQKVLLMKPQTYMNLSGEAVRPAAAFYKIPPERVLLVSDDVSLPTGKLRIRTSGSAGGHNGLKSIIACLGSDAFPRVKIGVGENQYPDLVDWVLGKPSDEDAKHIAGACDAAGDAALYYIANGAQATAGKFNGLSF